MTAPDTIPPQPRRRRRKGGLLALIAFLVMVVSAAGVGFALVGRPVEAPEWVRARIEQRLAEAIPGLNVDFGRMSLQVEGMDLARFVLWDVDLRNEHGEAVAALSDIEAGLSAPALMRGKLELKELRVSGAFVTMQRDERGRFGLALGDVFAKGTTVPDMAEIVAQVDRAVQTPRLAGLTRFEADALTIRYEDLRAQRGWTADGGRLRLERDGDRLRVGGDVALLSGGAGVATVELNAESRIGETAVDFGIVLGDLGARDIATQSPALAWLDDLDAPISGALRSEMGEDGNLGLLVATLRIGKGVFQPTTATRAIPFDGAQTYFTYNPKDAKLSFDEISLTTELGKLRAEGWAQLDGLDTGWPEGLTGQFRLSNIELTQGTLFDHNARIAGADVSFKSLFDPFKVTVGELRSTDPKLPIRSRGTLSAAADGWQLALDAFATETTPEQVLSFWPTGFKPKTRNWVVENVFKGALSDITFALRAKPNEKPHTYLDFRFDGGEVRYTRALPPVSNGQGRLVIDGNRLSVRVDAGQIEPGDGGAIDVSGSEFVIPDLRQKPEIGRVEVRATGTMTAGLALVDNDTWRVLRKINKGTDLAQGQVRVSGRLKLPLVKGVKLDQVDMKLTGVLSDVRSDKIVPDRVLAADQLEMTVTNSRFSIKGAARMDGVPVRGEFTQPFKGGEGRVVAAVDLSDKHLRALGAGLPRGLVSGAGTGQFELNLPKGQPPRFTLTSSLAGLGLSIPELGWRLGRNSKGSFRISGRLGKTLSVDELSLKAAGLDARGTLTIGSNNLFETLTLSRLRIGSWMDVVGRLRSRGKGRAPAIEVTSGRVDLRQSNFAASGSTGGGGGGGSPMKLALNELRVTDSIRLRNFRGDFRTSGGFQGEFTGSLGKGANIAGVVVPRQGGSAFRITATDAGRVLGAAGLQKNVSDGKLRLDMTPVPGRKGSYDGRLVINGTRLRNTPAIAALLDAISIVGILDQLNGPGIYFDEVEALFRLTPSQVILSRSSAVGPSMGISMDGYYDLAAGRMDMQGVVSPVYVLNAIGRLVSPRKGEGLIGFNFNIRGSVDKPRVAVNPLSVFTPGLFREIFRRPPPKVSQ